MLASSLACRHAARTLARPRAAASLVRGCRGACAPEPHRVLLFPGDGIGPEIAEAVVTVFDRCSVPIAWDPHPELSSARVSHSAGDDLIPPSVLEPLMAARVALKAPLATPVGKSHRSLNLALRQACRLYANVRPCASMPGQKTRHAGIDLVTIRENTEGEYCGIEQQTESQRDGRCIESYKLVTRPACNAIAAFACTFTAQRPRKRLTALHRANMMPIDHVFLDAVREHVARTPGIEYEEMLVDHAMRQLVIAPEHFDVLVAPNLYGDIVSDLTAGLIGGLGLAPSANIGHTAAVFEAVHGTAPDIAGKGLANPTALLLSAIMMLRHLNLTSHADVIEAAIHRLYMERKVLPGDVGGTANIKQFTDAVVAVATAS